MRTLAILSLVLALSASLCACGRRSDPTTPTTTEPTTTNTTPTYTMPTMDTNIPDPDINTPLPDTTMEPTYSGETTFDNGTDSTDTARSRMIP